VKKRGGVWKGESMAKKIRRCVTKEERGEEVRTSEVRWMRKALGKWVVTVMDKNTGMLFICCPVWYW
jgi:hypothetical protein